MITATLLQLQKTGNAEFCSPSGDWGSSVPVTLFLGGLFLDMRKGYRDATPLIDRWWARVEKLENGCWPWKGELSVKGYGRFTIGRKKVLAYRWGYEQLIGPVQVGLELDHLCRNHACVNPDHLEPVTHIENVRRGLASQMSGELNRAKTHCPNGHPYNEENTYWRKARRGRNCRICGRQNARAYRANASV